MSPEEAQKAIDDARAKLKEAKLKRDGQETIDLVEMLTSNLDYERVLVPEAPPDLPGSIVVRPPTKGEHSRFRSAIWGEDREAKAKAGAELARDCRVWPSEERYNELLKRCPGAADRASAACQLLARGEEKK